MNKTILLFLITASSLFGGNFATFSGIHDSLDVAVKTYLEKHKYEKVRIRVDDIAQKDGTLLTYPFVKISDSLFVVNVAKIPGIENKYSYSLLILTSPRISVLDTLGPYWDGYAGEIKFESDKSGITKLIVKVINPPHPDNMPFTLIEYTKVNGKFKESKK